MTEYLKEGEPYLKTSYGTFLCYWDGLGHYAMYIAILAAMSWNQSFREVGLYWAGSIGHSMIVFIPGNVVGKYGLRWSFLLNVPYIFIPFLSAARFLKERPREKAVHSQAGSLSSILKRPLDFVFVFGLVISMGIAFFRGFAILGCSHSLLQDYVKEVEPYLEDPVAYPKIQWAVDFNLLLMKARVGEYLVYSLTTVGLQMLVYLFHFVPYYCMAIYGLLYPTPGWMSDWALIHAGAAAQAQVTHIGASLHHRTPYILRVPPTRFALRTFWAVNLFLLFFPQFLARRCFKSDSDAISVEEKKK